MKHIYKTCTVCSHNWQSLVDLIRDENLTINGYQASFSKTIEGLFLLTHMTDGCGTTIAIRAGQLREICDEPKHTTSMAYSPDCNGHCMDEDNLSPCDNACDMRWARDVIQILKNHGPDELLSKLEASSTDEAA